LSRRSSPPSLISLGVFGGYIVDTQQSSHPPHLCHLKKTADSYPFLKEEVFGFIIPLYFSLFFFPCVPLFSPTFFPICRQLFDDSILLPFLELKGVKKAMRPPHVFSSFSLSPSSAAGQRKITFFFFFRAEPVRFGRCRLFFFFSLFLPLHISVSGRRTPTASPTSVSLPPRKHSGETAISFKSSLFSLAPPPRPPSFSPAEISGGTWPPFFGKVCFVGGVLFLFHSYYSTSRAASHPPP